jgi:hypothetical protein
VVVYQYTVKGTAHAGQTWEVRGRVQGRNGDFPDLLHEAMRDSFQLLTQGRAIYGSPGKGCNGPYQVTHFSLDKEEASNEA